MKLAEIFSNYFTVRQELYQAIKDLTQEQLDWHSKNHPWSVADILRHIAAVEAWWIDGVVLNNCKEPEAAEFDQATTLPQINTILEKYYQMFSDYLRDSDMDDWDEVFYHVKQVDEKVSKRWLVWHVVEHQARHRGQMHMLMTMQGVEVPRV